VGRYAFMMPKPAMFRLGARPVIYGLSQDVQERRDTTPFRIIETDQLPLEDSPKRVVSMTRC
jgi:hypothetical protein